MPTAEPPTAELPVPRFAERPSARSGARIAEPPPARSGSRIDAESPVGPPEPRLGPRDARDSADPPPPEASPPEALPDSSVRALVIDSHAPSRIGLAALLSEQAWIERCLLAAGSEESLALTRRHRPDVAILDISQTGPFAGSITAAIRDAHPGVQILLTSRCRTSPGAPPASLGAVGFLPAGASPQHLIDSVRTAVIGGEPLDFPPDPAPPHGPDLTEREREILLLIGSGKTNREIAAHLHLGPDSIKKTATVLYRKLGVRNRTEAARHAELVLGQGFEQEAAA